MANDGGLFLMEVLIDKISFLKSPCFSDKDFRTCVTVAAPSVEPLEICDDDPGQCAAKSGGPFVKTLNSGKSCLFSLKDEDIAKAMCGFPVQVTVYKSLPCECILTKIIMGQVTIDLTKEFVQSRNKHLEDPANVSCQALKDSFQLLSPEGVLTGSIVIFLRISCFGKLIITRFNGAGPATLGADRGPAIIDRSCNPPREFQTSTDPCVCGAARVAGVGKGVPGTGPPCQHGGRSGGGPCPIAQDPWNAKPCEDPDEICYCSGPRPPPQQPMVCRNMDQYCLHVPKGVLPSLPISPELTEEQRNEIEPTNKELKVLHVEDHSNFDSSISGISIPWSETATRVDEYLQSFTDIMKSSAETIQTELDQAISICTIMSRHRVSFSNTVEYVSKFCSHYPNYRKQKSCFMPNGFFGQIETTVYVTLFDDLCRRRTSGTQATGSVNKCLQASQSRNIVNYNKNSNLVYHTSNSNSCTSTFDSSKLFVQDNRAIYSDVYRFGMKRDEKGMGSKHRQPEVCKKASKSCQRPTDCNSATQTCCKPNKPKVTLPKEIPKKSKCPAKNVSIKVAKPCPSAVGVTKGDMMATVSHIKIGPRESCPVHGKEPCQGPKCIIATSEANEQAPIKVSTVANARRGVFELVIRRLNGAPLATNELMLEWTPPPCRPPPCGSPCVTPCTLSGPCCRPSKC